MTLRAWLVSVAFFVVIVPEAVKGGYLMRRRMLETKDDV